MRKLKLIFLSMFVIAIVSSCEEDFNPYSEFKEKFVFNCVIRGDTTFQFATLDRIYVVDGLNPYDNHEDPSVKGAVIKIWFGDSVKIFKEDSVLRSDTLRYHTPFSYYFNDNFVPPQNSTLDVEVLLPNGKRLTSSIQTPRKAIISAIESDFSLPVADRDYIKMRWAIEVTEVVYVPRLYIPYFKNENGINVRYLKQIPISYEKVGDQYIPNNPVPSTNVALAYDMDVIDRAMQEISEGDPNKENYTILGAIFEVLALDDFLSKYYTSTAFNVEEFSIKRVDQTDFTNINGGYGIFGCHFKTRYSIKIKHDYIESFGYIPGLTE
ncbi:MAG: hypothetical protein A2V66_01080 [Ignavibacteria bacterium RBG_13_36_8]|nr:MAG: hypothetical protein A2V66_01080 [Ignavibacteria bacterium RBG_13_36_8]